MPVDVLAHRRMLGPAPGLRPFQDSAVFDRIGGQATVDRLVDALYDRFQGDHALRPLFGRDLSSQRRRQKLFFAEWLGGRPAIANRPGARCIAITRTCPSPGCSRSAGSIIYAAH